MNRRMVPFSLVLTALLLCPAGAARGQDSAVEDARRAAEEWLALVDAGEYADSWQAAASLFKGAVSKENWVVSLNGARAPLGELVSRRVKTTQYATSLPGAPDGEYVVIQCETVFEHKSEAVETVTPMKDADGTWRVAGYYIR